MQKIVYLFSVVSLMLVSCSDDGENSAPILVTKIIETIEYNGSTETHTLGFNYDGNKLVSQTYNGSEISNVIYDGNLIKQILFKWRRSY